MISIPLHLHQYFLPMLVHWFECSGKPETPESSTSTEQWSETKEIHLLALLLHDTSHEPIHTLSELARLWESSGKKTVVLIILN